MLRFWLCKECWQFVKPFHILSSFDTFLFKCLSSLRVSQTESTYLKSAWYTDVWKSQEGVGS